jgi:hypothetical protein
MCCRSTRVGGARRPATPIWRIPFNCAFLCQTRFPSARMTLPTPHQTTRIEPIPLMVAPSANMLGPSSALGSSGACGDSICRSVFYLRNRLSLSSSSSAVSGASVQMLKRSGVPGDRKMGTPRVRLHQPRHGSSAATAQVSATFWQHLLATADERISVIRNTPLCRCRAPGTSDSSYEHRLVTLGFPRKFLRAPV